MSEYQKREIPPAHESLHWISYNIKQLTKVINDTNAILKSIQNAMYYHKPDSQASGGDIPF